MAGLTLARAGRAVRRFGERRLPGPVMESLRQALNPLRLRPSALILGAQRSGSTSLYSWLAAHPGVRPPEVKEAHFFSTSRWRREGLRCYAARFPLRPIAGRTPPITLEATATYLFHPNVPGRVARALPRAKFVAVLRNPIDRAWSHLKLERGRDNDALPFSEAVRREEERIGADLRRMVADESFESPLVPRWSYLARGRYAEQIERWWKWFPRERLLVLRSEDLWTGDDSAARKVERHLGLEPAPRPYPRAQATSADAGPDPETRRWLAAYFEPHNRRLRELLGDEFRWE